MNSTGVIALIVLALLLPLGPLAVAGESGQVQGKAALEEDDILLDILLQTADESSPERREADLDDEDILSEILALPAPMPAAAQPAERPPEAESLPASPTPPVLPEPAPPPAAAPSGVAKRKQVPPPIPSPRGRLGLRAGYMIPVGADRDFEGNALLGLYYRNALRTRPRISYELGLDLLRADSKDDNASSQIYAGRFELLYALGGKLRMQPYVLSGLAGLLETTDEDAAGEAFTNFVGAVNLGAGMVFAGGRVELRATHSVLLGTDNVKGLSLLSLAFGF